jgi:predicted ferric reductase
MAGRALLHWGAFALAVAVPLGVAATSPLLQWRDPVYIAAGFAGVAGLALMLAQPLLAKGYLPHMRGPRGRRWHRWTGMALIALIIVHVGGLWITSPPDVIDALLLRSMVAAFAAALVAALRRKLPLRPVSWRWLHTGLAVVLAGGTVLHAVLIEGTMGTVSKAVLCALVLAATGAVVVAQWRGRHRGGARATVR